jgi:hypothetical protein
MKKCILSIIITALVFTASASEYVWTGAGVHNATITTTPQFFIVPNTNYCYAVSVIETGETNDVFWEKTRLGVTTELVATNGFAGTNALSTAAGKSYTSAGGTVSNEDKNRKIGGVVLSTKTGTATANINFE